MYYYNYYKSLVKTYTKAIFNKDKKTPGHGSPNHGFIKIGILDPTIISANMGDFIIYQAVSEYLENLYPWSFFMNYPTATHTSFYAKQSMGGADILFVAGTNLLSSNLDKRDLFKLDPGHKLFLKNNVVLFGVGWWQYQDKPNNYTANFYKKIFRQDCLHSVRDSYTLDQLKSIGINNVVNTACPSMWNLNSELCESIPVKKTKDVITTLTFYHKNPELDRKLIEILVDSYHNVYLWVQGINDIDYLASIYKDYTKIKLVGPSLKAYDQILLNEDIEYLGTRLHAGIRAIQKGKRAQIVAVDNRAIEISKDTNLNVIKRENIENITNFIEKEYKTEIHLPISHINEWKKSLPFRG